MPHILPPLLELSKSTWPMCQTRTHFLPPWGTNLHNGAILGLLLYMLPSHASWRCSSGPCSSSYHPLSSSCNHISW
jgi:hypothetical protein